MAVLLPPFEPEMLGMDGVKEGRLAAAESIC